MSHGAAVSFSETFIHKSTYVTIGSRDAFDQKSKVRNETFYAERPSGTLVAYVQRAWMLA